MSDDPLISRLSRFTPDGSSLDREALLFAAGRASARRGRRWMALAAVLAASQLMTVGLLVWPRSGPPPAVPFKAMPPIVAVEPVLPPAAEVPGLLTLRDRVIAAEGNLPEPAPTEPLVPAEPPLRAFGAPPQSLLKLIDLIPEEKKS